MFTGKGMGCGNPVQAHLQARLFSKMMLLDSKSHECLSTKSRSETKIQFTLKIFHNLPLCFSYGMEFLVFSKNLFTIFQVLLLVS